MSECRECNKDVSELINWETLCEDYIELCYDEIWYGEEEKSYWWSEGHIEE
jgi:hypothetical protein